MITFKKQIETKQSKRKPIKKPNHFVLHWNGDKKGGKKEGASLSTAGSHLGVFQPKQINQLFENLKKLRTSAFLSLKFVFYYLISKDMLFIQSAQNCYTPKRSIKP